MFSVDTEIVAYVVCGSRSSGVSFSLGTNIGSLRIARQLESTRNSLSTGFERLSSGARINRASDDAAGLAIAASLNAKTRIANQGIRNTNDAVSLLNIGESAVGALTQIVMRQRELAEQSANGVYSDEQRSALDNEYQALTLEYNRILEEASFNGRTILEGSSGALDVQAGGESIVARLLPQEVNQTSSVTYSNSTLNVSNGKTILEPDQALIVTDYNGDGFDDLISIGLESGADVNIVIRRAIGSASGLTDMGAIVIAAPSGATKFNFFRAELRSPALLELETTFQSAPGRVEGEIALDVFGFTAKAVNPSTTAKTTVTGDFNNDGVDDTATTSNLLFPDSSALILLSQVNSGSIVTVTSLSRGGSGILSVEQARNALDSLANDLALLSQTSATLGASLSRMETVRGALLVRSSAFTEAASRIESADIAAESAKIIKGRISEQLAAAVFAQNNLQAEQVLRLLN